MAGVKGNVIPLAWLRGGSSLSGCRVESPALGTGAKRPVQVKGETLPSEVNAMRHFVLGIIRRKTLTEVLNAYPIAVGESKKNENRIGKDGEKMG